MVVTRSKNDTANKNSKQSVPSLDGSTPTISPESLKMLYNNYYKIFGMHENMKTNMHRVDTCLKELPPRVESLGTKFLQIKTKLHKKFDIPRGERFPNESFCPYQDCEDLSYSDSSVESHSEFYPSYEYGDIVLIRESIFKDEIGRMFKVVYVDREKREVVVERPVTKTIATFDFRAIMCVSKLYPKGNNGSANPKKRKMNSI